MTAPLGALSPPDLASAANQTLHGRIGSYHALWRVVGALGFVLFWAFNHVRFEAQART